MGPAVHPQVRSQADLEHAVSAGVDHEEAGAAGGHHVGGPDPDVDALARAQRPGVVELEHPLPHSDQPHGPPAVGCGDATRLHRGLQHLHATATGHHGQGIPELVGHEEPPTGGNGIVGKAPHAGGLHAAARKLDMQEPVCALPRHEDGTSGPGEPKVSRRLRQADAADDPSAVRIDEGQSIGVRQPYRNKTAARIHRKSFGLVSDLHDASGWALGEQRRARRLGGRRQLHR